MPDSVVKVQKYAPEHFLTVFGKNLPAIMNAVNGIHGNTEELIQACIDQLFIQTASGRYLIQNGEQRGFTMPENSGLDINAYRLLVPLMVADPKQVRITINDLVRAFYGSERTQPSMDAWEFGPYALAEGDSIVFETETGLTEITLTAGQVSDFSNVSARELVSVINTTQSAVVASVQVDRSTNNETIRVTTATSSSSAFIRVAGGTIQNVLHFPFFIITENATGTTWNLTKDSTYSDELKFTWDGVGTNPNVFNAKAGDVVTIRGLVAGAQDFSLLNGSYVAVDVGYDYFIIRNELFDHTAATLVENSDDAIVFTSARKLNLYDQDEFAFTSETENETITVTVPAVPPITRELQGSAHLHGHEAQILDFTRSSVQVQLAENADKPIGANWFILSSDRMRHDFRMPYYKTNTVDADPLQPTYAVSNLSDEFSVFPYTVATAFTTTDPIFGNLGESTYDIDMGLVHGLRKPWGFDLQGATGLANVSAADVNKEHTPLHVIDKSKVRVTLKDSNGDPIVFEGVTWNTADLYRQPTLRADGADFYLQFSSTSTRVASGLYPGTRFNFDLSSGTDVDPYLAQPVKLGVYAVVAVVDEFVYFRTGRGHGPDGLISTAVTGNRSAYFGGPSMEYYVDKASAYNQENLFPNLRLVMLGYTASSNPAYNGSFLYDPLGSQSNVTVSQLVIETTEIILKGETKQLLLVNSVGANDELLAQRGSIVLDYGFDTFEGPIEYHAVIPNPGADQIQIDPSYKFQHSHAIGSQVSVLRQTTAYVPSITGEDLAFYLTGTTAARDTLFELMDLLVAFGIFVEEDIIFPELRYDDPAIPPFE